MHLARAAAVIEGISHGQEHFGILRVEVVEYCLCKLVLHGKPVEELMACRCHRQVKNGIESRIRTDQIEHLRIVVADRTDMELLCPALVMVHPAEIKVHRALELEHILLRRSLALEGVAEDLLDLVHLEVLCIEGVDTMV